MATPAEWVRTCPYCFASPAPFQGQQVFQSTGAEGRIRRWQPATCPACGGAAIFEQDPSTGVNLEMHPGVVGEWDVAHVPADVRPIWDEAVKVFRVSANASAVVACGRTLEAAAQHRNIEGKTLQQRIGKMLNDGLITTEFKGAMDYVRLIRNVGAHAGSEVSRESAEGTMRFTQQTLRLLFEVPGELSRLTGHPPELDAEEEQGDDEA